MSARRAIGVVLAASVLFPVSVMAAPAVSASEQEQPLQFSMDGVSFGPTLTRPVLESVEPIVPGGSIQGPVWVRNNTGDDAVLSVSALAGSVAVALEQELRVLASTDRWTGATNALGTSGTCTNLAVGLPLEAGETTRLALTLHFDADAPNETMRQTAEFALRFRMQDARGAEPTGACADPSAVVIPGVGSTTPVDRQVAQPSHGTLAYTGASPLPWVAGGAAAIGLGGLLVALIRRRSSEEGQTS